MSAISQSSDAAVIVQKQLDAYNARDIDTFMALWSDDAQLFAHPATLLPNGAAEIRERHIARFAEANLFGKLICRMAVGDMVVDREVVTRSFPEGPGRVDVIMIYQVAGAKIVKAWAKMGDPILDATT